MLKQGEIAVAKVDIGIAGAWLQHTNLGVVRERADCEECRAVSKCRSQKKHLSMTTYKSWEALLTCGVS